MRYRLTDEEWDSAFEQIRQVLTRVARAGDLITYRDLSRSIEEA